MRSNLSIYSNIGLLVLYIVAMLTTQQPAQSVTRKFRKQLKSEDFVLIAQESKQYQHLVKILQEREAMLSSKVAELERNNARLENERDQYKTLNIQLSAKLQQYESIRVQLLQEYKLLKKQIDRQSTLIVQRQSKIGQLSRESNELHENVIHLQQTTRNDALVIQELRNYVAKLQREIVDKKIKLFSQMVESAPYPYREQKKQNTMDRANKSNNGTFKTSANYQSSKNSSNTNSVSFSFVSNQSASRKASRVKRQDKSLYL